MNRGQGGFCKFTRLMDSVIRRMLLGGLRLRTGCFVRWGRLGVGEWCQGVDARWMASCNCRKGSAIGTWGEPFTGGWWANGLSFTLEGRCPTGRGCAGRREGSGGIGMSAIRYMGSLIPFDAFPVEDRRGSWEEVCETGRGA